MLRLRRDNVVKHVDSETKAKRLISEGFVLTSQPSFVNAVTTLRKPEASDSDEDRVPCPYCEKDYVDESGVRRHVKDKHPEKFEEYEELTKE